MPEAAEEQVQTIPVANGAAEQPQDTGTGAHSRSASLLALNALEDSSGEVPAEQPAETHDPGEDGSVQGDNPGEGTGEEFSTGEEPVTPPEGEESQGGSEGDGDGDDDGLVEVELYPGTGIMQRVTPQQKALIDRNRELEQREREIEQRELKFYRKQAGKANHEAKKSEGKADDPEPQTPPKMDMAAVEKAALTAFTEFDRTNDGKSLLDFGKALTPVIAEGLGEEIRVAGYPIGDILRDMAAEYGEMQEKLKRLEQGYQQTHEVVGPEIERKGAIAFARTDLGFSDAPEAALVAAYDAARPEWDEEIRAIGLDPDSEQAKVMRGRVLARHVKSQVESAQSAATKPTTPPRNTPPRRRPPVTTAPTPASPRQASPEGPMRRSASLATLVESGH